MSWASRWCIAGADNLQQVDHMCMMSAVEGYPSLRMTLWSLCGNFIMENCHFTIMELSIHFHRFPAPCCTELSPSICSENCAPGGCQSNWHQNTKHSAWSQHWHSCSGTMMMATSFCIGSSQVMKRGLHTWPQKPSSSQCIGITEDVLVRWNSGRLCRCRKWCAWCSGTDGAFSSLTSWSEVKRWMLSITAKPCRNCDGPFRTRSIGFLVLALSCCMIMLSHTPLDGQHICRSSAGWCLIIHPIAWTSCPVISIFSYTSSSPRWLRG